MNYHKVSVYTRSGVLAHVQSTNGDEWPGGVTETDSAGVSIPLVRIDVELEPTAAEIARGANGRPASRRAAVLFKKELEVVAGKVRYRAGEGGGGAIVDRAAVVLPT
jgi:hypothetical protein